MYQAHQFFEISVPLEGYEIQKTAKIKFVRSLEDLTILFRAFLAYIFPFQSSGGAKTIGARNTFLTASIPCSIYLVLVGQMKCLNPRSAVTLLEWSKRSNR